MQEKSLQDGTVLPKEEIEPRRSKFDELKGHFVYYGTDEEFRTDPEGVKWVGQMITLVVRVKEQPFINALDKMAATLRVDRETLIWRAIEEFVAPQTRKI